MGAGDFAGMLDDQRALQVGSFGADPAYLVGDERMDYIRWNMLALINELNEVLDETDWKPWSHGARHVDEGRAVNEMVDAWHFFMNLLWAVAGEDDAETLASRFVAEYQAKRDVNRQRQLDGYVARRPSEETVEGAHSRDLVLFRSLVEFPSEGLDASALFATSARLSGYRDVHGVYAHRGTMRLDASYLAIGANAYETRRCAVELATLCGVKLDVVDVKTVCTLEHQVIESHPVQHGWTDRHPGRTA